MITYCEIIEREFRKEFGIPNHVIITVDMSEEEVIKVIYDGNLYLCECDCDTRFVFVSEYHALSINIPEDWHHAAH